MHISRKILLFISIFYLSSFSISIPELYAEIVQHEKTDNILKLLVFTDNKDPIGYNWNKYLREHTMKYSSNDFQIALKKLKSEYEQSYANLTTCIEGTNKKTQEYTSAWTTDLQKQFNKEYLHKNYDNMRFIIISLSVNNNIAACKEQEKEAIYREYRQLDATKYYIKTFVEFSRTLSKEEFQHLGAMISASENYLRDFEYPLQSILSDEGLKEALFSVALSTQKDSNPKLMDFFSHHPLFMKPFSLIKVLNDLKTLQ